MNSKRKHIFLLLLLLGQVFVSHIFSQDLTLVKPKNGIVIKEVDIFQWNPTNNNSNYELILSQDSLFLNTSIVTLSENNYVDKTVLFDTQI